MSSDSINNSNNNSIIHKKWAVHILFLLYHNQKVSYRKIKSVIQIPNSTLTTRVNELVKHGYLDKFIYGNTHMPHYTDYSITKLGLDYINNLVKYTDL